MSTRVNHADSAPPLGRQLIGQDESWSVGEAARSAAVFVTFLVLAWGWMWHGDVLLQLVAEVVHGGL